MQPVQLFVYDLLGQDPTGMARGMLQQLVPNMQGIWHTAVVVFGKEYFFGGGIQQGSPGQTHFGTPAQRLDKGTTAVTQEIFESFLVGLRVKYSASSYNILSNNCNHFSEEVCQFLTGTGIPPEILQLPQQFVSSPIGQMLQPIIDQFMGGQFTGAAPDMSQLASMMGAGGMGGLGGMGGGLGGLGGAGLGAGARGMPGMFGQPRSMFDRPASSAAAVPTPSASGSQAAVTASGHAGLSLPTLQVKSTQPTLFSACASAEKVIGKLKEFGHADAPELMTEIATKALDLLACRFAARKVVPDYDIPSGTFALIEALLQRLSPPHQFPALDVVRLLCLHPGANDYFSNPAQGLVDRLIRNVALSKDNNIPDACRILVARIICNIFATPKGRSRMIADGRLDLVMDLINEGLSPSKSKQMKHSASTIAYNCVLAVGDHEESILCILSAVAHALSDAAVISEETSFTLLMSLGKLVYENKTALDLLEALQPDLEPYLKSSVTKVQAVANEVRLLINTPLA